jgi:hypothetical protein
MAATYNGEQISTNQIIHHGKSRVHCNNELYVRVNIYLERYEVLTALI